MYKIGKEALRWGRTCVRLGRLACARKLFFNLEARLFEQLIETKLKLVAIVLVKRGCFAGGLHSQASVNFLAKVRLFFLPRGAKTELKIETKLKVVAENWHHWLLRWGAHDFVRLGRLACARNLFFYREARLFEQLIETKLKLLA